MKNYPITPEQLILPIYDPLTPAIVHIRYLCERLSLNGLDQTSRLLTALIVSVSSKRDVVTIRSAMRLERWAKRALSWSYVEWIDWAEHREHRLLLRFALKTGIPLA